MNISLSPKFLRPLVRISYDSKAPASAAGNIDNIEEKLRDIYGVIHTDAAEYAATVLEAEKKLDKFGVKVGEVTSKVGSYDVHKVPVTQG